MPTDNNYRHDFCGTDWSWMCRNSHNSLDVDDANIYLNLDNLGDSQTIVINGKFRLTITNEDGNIVCKKQVLKPIPTWVDA